MGETEADLIARACSADTDAFCQLAERYERRIYSLALHYCHNPHDAEDLSQEVWLKAYRAIGTFRGESAFYTWIRKITINCFLNSTRAQVARWYPASFTDENLIGGYEARLTSANSETTFQNRILFASVMDAMSSLTPRQRLIFALKHQEGMTYEEIATAIGCSTGTVKKAVARAVAKLRVHLQVNAQPKDRVQCAAEY